MESVAGERPQYCDIVMKGGITSGVVYPLAAVELRKRNYEFRNVGGTSAGAIAAAAVAAAEHGRRSQLAQGDPYQQLADLPEELGKGLTSLFQPSPRMRPLFELLLIWIGEGRAPGKIARSLLPFRDAALAGALPGLALLVVSLLVPGGGFLHLIAALLALLAAALGAVVAAGLSAASRVRSMPDNHFGLCLGNDRDGDAATPPLTRWLSALIDELAGKEDGEPLTFGDLWRLDGRPEERGVNLQMVTSNLSQRRPYSLPFEAGEEFWFDPEELLDFFPREVVDHMVHNSPSETTGAAGRTLRALPPSEQLPVVFATRLSLSFPGLICAVPLYAVNHAPEANSEAPERCWFSDGGITSNFPVHFFDSPVPRWPTFAIDLMETEQVLKDKEGDNIWLPKTNEEGLAEAWLGWEGKSDWKRLAAFGEGIFRTAQNWIDNRQMTGAGFRDRIAHVLMVKGEGGMNLEMDKDKIERLAERGGAAAAALAERFRHDPPAGAELTWDNQKWIRYRAYMELLERHGRLARRGFLDAGLGTPLREMRSAPPSYPWGSPQQGRFSNPEVDRLLAEFEAWEQAAPLFAGDAPPPRTEPWSIPRV
ncbi:MAG TPA: patatin-like phospholipase family protein [Solirubrobacterales bacterium]|nr:patatin-like phospholipase family protein [Solirubrobacterales bacterium]